MITRREYRLIISTDSITGRETCEMIPLRPRENTVSNFDLFNSYINYTTNLSLNQYASENYIDTTDLEDIIVSMPLEQFDRIAEKETIENENCAICTDPIEIHEVVKDLQCNHIFHIGCLRSHLTMYSVKCPVCRADCRY